MASIDCLGSHKREGSVNGPNQNYSPDEPVPSTHITDLNDDCLAHVFKKLDLKSLLNVADSTKLFKQAADLAFESKFGKKEVIIRNWSRDAMTAREDRIGIWGRFCLKLLRSFGHLITELEYSGAHHPSPVDCYINKYCANSLIKVTFKDVSFSLDTNIKEPYSKAETVHIQGGEFKSHSVDLSACFPLVRRLTLYFVNKPARIDRQFTHLEHIKIDNCYGSNTSLPTFIDLNPQLRGLEVDVLWGRVLNPVTVLSASENLPNLESIGFAYSGFGFSEDRPIQFGGVKKVQINLHSHDHLHGTAQSLPFIFGQLEECTLEWRLCYWNECILNFISKYPMILKLRLAYLYTAIEVDKLKLAKLLPSVREVDMAWITLSVDEVNTFLSECKQLKKLHFMMAQPNEFKMLHEQLKDRWMLKMDKYGHVILEKLHAPQTEARQIPIQIWHGQNAPPTFKVACDVASASSQQEVDGQGGATQPATKRTIEMESSSDDEAAAPPPKRPIRKCRKQSSYAE